MTSAHSLGPLNPVAESFWHLSKLMNTHSCEVVSVRASIEEADLQCAIKRVSARHPLLRARVSPRGLLRPHWRPASDELELEVITLERPLFERSEEGLGGLWAGPLPPLVRSLVWCEPPAEPTQGPLARFVLLREPELSHLLLIAPHMCTDARAGALIVSEVLQTLKALSRGELDELGEQEARAFDSDDPLSLAHLSVRARWWWRGIALWRLARDVLTSGRGVTLPRDPKRTPRGETLLCVLPITPHELKGVLNAAKEKGLTAHVLFTQALCALERKEREGRGGREGQLRIADLFALTQLYPPQERARSEARFDVLVQPHLVNLPLSRDEVSSFKALRGALNRLKGGEAFAELYRLKLYNLIARLTPTKWVSGALFSWVLKTTTTTTNPGPVRALFDEAGPFQVVDFLNFPQLSPPARLGIIYTTFRGRLRLVVLHDEALMSSEEAERFAQRLWAEVLTLAQAPTTCATQASAMSSKVYSKTGGLP